MRGGQFCHGNVTGGFVSDKGIFCGLFAVVGCGKFREVSVIIAFHLVIKDFGFAALSARNQVLVEDAEDVAADISQFFLHLKSVKNQHLPNRNFMGTRVGLFLDFKDWLTECKMQWYFILQKKVGFLKSDEKKENWTKLENTGKRLFLAEFRKI